MNKIDWWVRTTPHNSIYVCSERLFRFLSTDKDKEHWSFTAFLNSERRVLAWKGKDLFYGRKYFYEMQQNLMR